MHTLDYQPYGQGFDLFDTSDLLNRDHPLAQGLVSAYFGIQEVCTKNTWYDICKTNNGLLVNNPSLVVGGATIGVPGSLKLIGASSQYVALGTPASLKITGPITVSCWLRLTTLVTANSPTLASLGYDGATVGWALGFNQMGAGPSNGLPRLTFLGYNGAAFGSYTTTDFSTLLGIWTHVVGTWDRTQWNTYVNGVLDRNSQGTQSTPPQSSTAPVCVGAQSSSGSIIRFLDGSINAVAIHARALSAAEVFALYQETRQGCPTLLRRVCPTPFQLSAPQGGFAPWLTRQSNVVLGGGIHV